MSRLAPLVSLVLWLPIVSPVALASGSDPGRIDAEGLVAWARPKVVLVQVQGTGAPRWATGFVAERGRVITNEHVVRGARSVTVWTNGTPYRARVAAVDLPRDLAAL